MNFQQIRDFVNPAVGQATGIEPVENLAMPVPTAHMMQSGGGGSITVDSELSETSTNPVENRVITAALKNAGSDLNFIVNVVDNDGELSADKTYVEIRQAWRTNKIPVVVFREHPAEDENYVSRYSFFGSYNDSEQTVVIGFYHMTLDIEGGTPRIIYDLIEINENDIITGRAYQSDIQPLT